MPAGRGEKFRAWSNQHARTAETGASRTCHRLSVQVRSYNSRLTNCHNNPNSFRTRGKSREGAREEGLPQGFRAGRQKIAVAFSSSREGFGVSSTTS